MTATEVAVLVWGEKENHSRSWGARRVRAIARKRFPSSAPGQGREWDLNEAQVRLLANELKKG
jgi:hypothetical protein